MKSPEPRPTEPWVEQATLIPEPSQTTSVATLESWSCPATRDWRRNLGASCWLSGSREFFYSRSDDLASETVSAVPPAPPLFKIAFKGSAKEVSGLVSNDEEPENRNYDEGVSPGRDAEIQAFP